MKSTTSRFRLVNFMFLSRRRKAKEEKIRKRGRPATEMISVTRGRENWGEEISPSPLHAHTRAKERRREESERERKGGDREKVRKRRRE